MSRSFDGVDDRLNSAPGLVPGSQKFTVFAWIFHLSGGAGTVLAHGATTGRFRLTMTAAAPRVRFLGTGGQWDGPQTIPLNVWTSVAVTLDGATPAVGDCAIYYNGISQTVSRNAPSGPISSDAQILVLGAQNTGGVAFGGSIGEAAIWNRILTADEVKAVHELGVNAQPDHVFYAPLDSGSLQEFHGLTLVPTGAMAAENPPIRPVGRRG